MMNRLLTAMVGLLLSLIVFTPAPSRAEMDAPLDVRLLVNADNGVEGSYVYRILDKALASQSRPYSLSADVLEATQLRREESVRSSDKQYVIILGSSPKTEKTLQAVYIPVYLGLDLSQRIMLTRKEMEPELEAVRDLEDLKRFTFGQGLGWADVAILRQAGLKVFAPPSKDGIMRMLNAGRIDVFPRGLFEVLPEFDENREAYPDLVMDKHLVLTYPLASFFFVKKENRELHEALKNGLDALYASGRMQDMLMGDPFHERALAEIQLKGRRKIEIPTAATDATREALMRYPFIPGKPPGAPAR